MGAQQPVNRTIRVTFRSLFPALLAVVLLLPAFNASDVLAHLSIIRQGNESRGSREAGDLFGKALAMGDFNGDGFDDVAAGAPGEDLNSSVDAGAVTVNFSNHLGVNHVGAQLLTQGDFGVADQPSAQFGLAMVAGNFNNDAYDDLVVGSPYWDSGTILNCGAIWYFRGSASGLVAVTSMTQSAAGGVSETDDNFGFSFAAGNFNGDTYEDLAVGGPGEDSSAGAIFELRGSSSGPVVNGGFFKQSTLGGTNTAGDLFGYSLAAGNMISSINPQYDELAVGAPNKEGTPTNCGGVWLIHGGSSGLTSSSPVFYTAGSFDTQVTDGQFGWSLACGRFYGGSTDGLAIGEPGRTVGGQSKAGRVIVAKGGLSGPNLAGGFAVLQTHVGEVSESFDRFGYSLAAGDLDGPDSFQDLLVGCPNEGAGGAVSIGFIGVLFGGSNGPNGQYGWYGLFQNTLGDPVNNNDDFGWAFASGITDDSGRSTIVAGAPGDMGDIGLVHVFAPWRQVTNLACATSAVWNCDDELVFSQKPFEQICPASTTKIMTVLIACERSQLPVTNIKRVPLTSEYVVPVWVMNNIAGSKFNFNYHEHMTLEQLLYACIHPSGNDAAYAIADKLTGSDAVWVDHQNVVPEFVDEMNARAAQLGMTRTHFTNPAGLDLDGTHYSTAEDMLKLSRAAMNNSLFREVVGTLDFEWTRTWEDIDYEIQTEDGGTHYGWLDRFQDWVPAANGVKPGGTPCGHGTRCMAVPAGGSLDPVLVSSFGSDENEEANGADLAEIGLGACGNPTGFEYQANGYLGYVPNASTQVGRRASRVMSVNGDMPNVTLDVFRVAGSGNTSARVEMLRTQELIFAPSQTLTFGIQGGLEQQGEIVIQNLGNAVASLRIDMPYSSPFNITLDEGEEYVIPPHVGNPTNFNWTLQNMSGQIAAIPAWVTIDENYGWDLETIGTGPNPQFSTVLLRQGETDNLTFRILGLDPNPGSLLYASAHETGLVSAVGDEPLPGTPGAPPVTNVSASPNPFTSTTRISFTLAKPGDVTLSIYDIQGREVFRQEQENANPGLWSLNWDGRSNAAGSVAAGAYFYRLEVDGKSEASGKVVRVR